MESLTSDVNHFIGASDAILTSLDKIAEDIIAITPPGGPLRKLADAQVAALKRMREDKVQFIDRAFKDTFATPLNQYMNQYREIQSRVTERDRRGEEGDKLGKEKEKQSAKGDPRMGGTETRLEAARASYEDLNAELIRDMPILVGDSEKFFFPILALFILNQQKFWNSMTTQINWLAGNVDPATAHVPSLKDVITEKLASSMTRRYQSSSNPWATAPGEPSGGANPYAAPPGGSPYGTQPAATNPYGAAPVANAYPQAGFAPPQPIPPRPSAPAQPRVLQAQALWDFNGQPGELSFRAGEIVVVHSQQGEWWQGELRGQRGSFPGNYVKMM